MGLLRRQEVEKLNTKTSEQIPFFCNTSDPLSATRVWVNKLTKSRLYQAGTKESSETLVLWFKSTSIEKCSIVGHHFITLFSFTNFLKFSLIFSAPPKVMSGAQGTPPKAGLFPGFCCSQCFGTRFFGRWASQQWGRMKFPPRSNHLPPFPLPK